jgi:hypothetical protein
MDPVDHTKRKQVTIDFSRQSIRTDNLVLDTQHVQKQRYMGSDETPRKFGSIVVNYLDFNNILINRINYGS